MGGNEIDPIGFWLTMNVMMPRKTRWSGGQKEHAPTRKRGKIVVLIAGFDMLYKLRTPDQVKAFSEERRSHIVMHLDIRPSLRDKGIAVDPSGFYPQRVGHIQHAAWPTADIQHRVNGIAMLEIHKRCPIHIGVPKMSAQMRRQKTLCFG